MEDVLLLIRTSLKKNPEEWLFLEQYQSFGEVHSFMNIFSHEPTGYFLLLIDIPLINEKTKKQKHTYYLQLMQEDAYNEMLEDTGGAFSPDLNHVYQIGEKSTIVKILNFIKHLHIEDNKIIMYTNFKNYIKNKKPAKNKKVSKRKEEN
jgi:hypothetical protein